LYLCHETSKQSTLYVTFCSGNIFDNVNNGHKNDEEDDDDDDDLLVCGCRDRVNSIVLCRASNQLISAGEDSMLVCWDMDAKRLPVILLSFVICYCRAYISKELSSLL